MDLRTVDVTWVHQGLTHEELDIILRIVQIIANLFVFLVKFPNFCAAVARGGDQVIIVCGPVHVVDEVVVAGEDHFEGTVLRLNVIDLDDGPAGLHSARNSQISTHVRKFNLQTPLLVRVEFEYSLVGHYRLKI